MNLPNMVSFWKSNWRRIPKKHLRICSEDYAKSEIYFINLIDHHHHHHHLDLHHQLHRFSPIHLLHLRQHQPALNYRIYFQNLNRLHFIDM